MTHRTLGKALLLGLGALVSMTAVAAAQKPAEKGAGKLAWAPAPPFLPTGAKMAVVSGDPSKAGPYVLQLSMPGGYTIPPHQHPTDENLLIKSGAFRIGMGDKLDLKAMKVLKAGDKATAPAKMNHYAKASGATVVEVSGVGPFQITYVATGSSTVPK